MKLLIIVIISLFFSSCSSKRVSVPPSTVDIDKQEEKLKSIFLGQTYEDVNEIITLKNHQSFEGVEDGTTYQYKNYFNNETNFSLGFYFENKKLISVISAEDMSNLFSCRTPFKTNGLHWLQYGITPYSKWIVKRNTLNKNFNYRSFNEKIEISKNKSQQTFEDVTFAIVYSPFLIIASPFIFYDWATGKFEEDKQNAADDQLKRKYAESVTIGTSYNELKSQLGQENRIDNIKGGMALSYDKFHHSYGIGDEDQVIWKDSVSMFELFKRQKEYGQRFYGNDSCGDLDGLWAVKF